MESRHFGLKVTFKQNQHYVPTMGRPRLTIATLISRTLWSRYNTKLQHVFAAEYHL